jgi:hypothetical protein
LQRCWVTFTSMSSCGGLKIVVSATPGWSHKVDSYTWK